MYKDNVFILDNYMNIKEGFSILKVKLKSQDEPFEFPPDFAIAKEISEDLGYKRATIAKKGWYFSKGDALLI